jgi:hypothetical protein
MAWPTGSPASSPAGGRRLGAHQGNKCPYRSTVICTLAWPSCVEMYLMFVPRAICADAKKWRRACIRKCRRPACFRAANQVSRTTLAFNGRSWGGAIPVGQRGRRSTLRALAALDRIARAEDSEVRRGAGHRDRLTVDSAWSLVGGIGLGSSFDGGGAGRPRRSDPPTGGRSPHRT